MNSAERRANSLGSEVEELRNTLEQAERLRKQAENELNDANERLTELTATNTSLSGAKRKFEAELGGLHELQVRLDEAEGSALKGGKRIIQKLEERARELETELDAEQRRHAETTKNIRKHERKTTESKPFCGCFTIQFHIRTHQGTPIRLGGDKKNYQRMQDLVDKLQQKIKIYKRQIEETEEIAGMNLGKYRKLQQELGESERRAEIAEQTLQKLRAKNRSGGSAAPSAPAGKDRIVHNLLPLRCFEEDMSLRSYTLLLLLCCIVSILLIPVAQYYLFRLNLSPFIMLHHDIDERRDDQPGPGMSTASAPVSICPRPSRNPKQFRNVQPDILSSSGTFSDYEDVTEENDSAFVIEEVLSRTTINY
ncbi:putative Myosin heavy chain, muscle [Hypsibius exemplaris]|uniref:Myosin heavy chain, muscle n=1 Tax=Hypsibius exemplaris TaxID=2072580 RepID=A0A1W0XA02_HYPEX|nr:putative Myosin heavy chain, muscle [Hypsibius exemplaris]